jgi:transposase
MEKAHIIIVSVPKKGFHIMTNNLFFIGLDIAAIDLAASIYQSPDKPVRTKEAIPNNPEGFRLLVSWLTDHHVNKTNSRICMEATGVYSKAVAYYLNSWGFPVSVEPPLKVKRAFLPVGHKTDPVDSRKIAEYAYRYQDELRLWQPKKEIIEKIRQLLVTREQFTKQKVALINIIHAYSKEMVQVALINKVHQETLAQIEKQIVRIDQELNKVIKQDPDIFPKVKNLKTMPGCKMLLAANLIVMTDNFTKLQNPKQLAAFIGIVPYQHQSGSSVFKKPRIRNFGPQYIRKLLRLGSPSVATHNKTFRLYYLGKLAQGKAKALVLNNIANKLIKLACAIARDNIGYIKDHKSIHPMYLKSA